jgi:hypothetical protein
MTKRCGTQLELESDHVGKLTPTKGEGLGFSTLRACDALLRRPDTCHTIKRAGVLCKGAVLAAYAGATAILVVSASSTM